jgi:multiple sugar transport system permease protein
LRQRSRLERLVRENLEGYLFILPWLLAFFLFVGGPMLASLVLSFTDWDIISGRAPTFVGLENFINLFSSEVVWKSLLVTAYYVLGTVPLKVFIGLGIALLLVRSLPGANFFRMIFYLPTITTGVILALLWQWMYDPKYGLINTLLGTIGIQGPVWLNSPAWAMPALILMGAVYVGRYMIVFLAGLKGISVELYEAAQIDGANGWEQFRHITIPMLSPSIFFNIIMAVIYSFQVFTEAYVITGGGPVNSTLVYVFMIFREAFNFLHMGYAAALAWVLFLIILGFTLLQFRFSGWVHYEGER